MRGFERNCDSIGMRCARPPKSAPPRLAAGAALPSAPGWAPARPILASGVIRELLGVSIASMLSESCRRPGRALNHAPIGDFHDRIIRRRKQVDSANRA